MLLTMHRSADQEHVTQFCGHLSIDPKSHHYIDWPLPNMKSSTEKDFWGWRSTWGFAGEAWGGQIKIDGQWATILLYFCGEGGHNGKGGFAVAVYREYKRERVEYFTWSHCDHVYEGSRLGNCWHKYTCSKCGHSYEVDSSD
jgi:hypothetical protein